MVKKQIKKTNITNEQKSEEIKPKISKKPRRELQNEEGIKENQNTTGAIYVGHLPWGFTDATLKKYFEQFGHITRIICPKSSKTGRSVGYAFIEFGDEETARIAAKTMNNYILFEKILKCSFVEDKSKYDRIFLKWRKKFEFKQRYKEHCEKLNKKKSNEEIKMLIQGLLDREEKKREKMDELGIEYEYKGFKEIVDEYKNLHKKEINEKTKIRNNMKKEKKDNKNDNNKNDNKKNDNKNQKIKEEKNKQKNEKIKKVQKEEIEKEDKEEDDNNEGNEELEEENDDDNNEENEDEEMEEEEEDDEEEEEEEEEEEMEEESEEKPKKELKNIKPQKKIESIRKQQKINKMKEKEKEKQKSKDIKNYNKNSEKAKMKNKNFKK